MGKKYPDWYVNLFDLVLYWTVTDYCNLSCPGCIAKAKKAGSEYVPEKINISALKKTLDGLNKKIKIIFTGGEPLLIENIIDVFAEVTSKNFMVLISNLTSPKVKELAERIDPSRVIFLKASAHIMELERKNLLGTFFDHYNLLQQKGFGIHAEEIAYPVLAGQADKYRKIFLERGIELRFQAYKGMWKGKKYPDSYTKEDYKIFKFSDIVSASPVLHNRKEQKCNAGYNAFVGYPDGSVHRCYDIKENMGNIYTGFKLDNDLIRCPLDYCGCPLSVFDSILYEKAIDETKDK